MKWIAIVALLCPLLAPAGMPETPVMVKLRKGEDAVTVTSAANSTVVSITSRSGIGGARLLREDAPWPTRLVIRLNLKGLESFELNNGVIRLNTSLKSPAKTPFWKMGGNGKQNGPPDGTLELKITQAEDCIEVMVPKEMLEANPAELVFAWIDFYRH